jgi:penicillin-binding protein 1A
MLEKAVREGTGASLRSVYGIKSRWSGKTGTSQDYGDAWFLAFNNDIILATRVGATYPVIHFDNGASGSGSRLALPLIGKTLQKAQDQTSLRQKYFKDVEVTEAAASAIDCEDYIDDSEIEKFFENLFGNDNTTFEKASKKAKRQAKKGKRKSWFKRVFGKRDE